MLGLSMRLEVRQALTLSGGATESIFPEAEAWLQDQDHMAALEFAARRKNMSRYRSIIDFLFCEIFTNYQHACFRFYRGNGPQLRDVITVEQLLEFSRTLLKALEISYQMHREQQMITWAGLLKEVRKAA